MAITACWYWIRKLQARFHGGDFAAAVAAAENAAPLLWTSTEFFETAEYHFYARAGPRRAPRRGGARGSRRGTGTPWSRTPAGWAWARQCPENFRSRAALADAEIARIEGRVADAERLYESALTSARESGFAQNEAIAYEMAARFWRARGYPLFGDAYLQEACARYRRWGAEGKVRQLTRLTPRPRQAADRLANLARRAPGDLARPARPSGGDQGLADHLRRHGP